MDFSHIPDDFRTALAAMINIVTAMFIMHGLILQKACKTRRDPEIPASNTYQYYYQMRSSKRYVKFGSVIWLASAAWLVVLSDIAVATIVVVASVLVATGGILVQKFRMNSEPAKNTDVLHDDI